MEVQPTHSTTLKRRIGTVGEKLKESNVRSFGNRSVTEDVLSTTICIVEQTLNATERCRSSKAISTN